MSARIRARYTPMNIAHILGFPNKIPKVDWKMYLPRFKDEKDGNATIHLIKFRRHIHRLGLKFPQECLKKIFMASLEDNVRSWYEGLPAASLYSLKYFHMVFCKNYKHHYPSLLLIESVLWKI